MTQPESLSPEDALLAAQFAAGVAGDLKQVSQMTMRGSRVSKAPIIDPRKLLPKNIGATAKPVAPAINGSVPNNTGASGTGDPLAPRINLIPLPKGVSMEDVLRTEATAQPPVTENPISHTAPQQTNVQPDNQLEFTFDKQATLNEIYNRLDEIHSTVESLKLIVDSLNRNVATIIAESGKKKYRNRTQSEQTQSDQPETPSA